MPSIWLPPPLPYRRSARTRWTAKPRIEATTTTRYCVSPAAPVPSTLPPSSWRGVAAVISSSMTRLLFSSATLEATHVP